MTNNNITKEKWRERTRESLSSSISTLLNQTETTGIRLVILKERPEGDIVVARFATLTYKKEQLYEFFYFGPTEDVSEFGVYQKRMSLTKHGKSICLMEDQTIEQLSYEETRCYNDAITNFVMANIVWE